VITGNLGVEKAVE